MPGYMTHYIFGKKEFKKLSENEIKNAIRENRNVFNLGLQGPDIFFYFPGYLFINKKNLGSIMHRNKTGECMERMLDFVCSRKNERERKIAIAYLAGFLGHYQLDISCHPYIYHKTDYMNREKGYHGKHVALETDIDYLLGKSVLKKKISEVDYGRLVKLNKKQCEVVGKMLSRACSETYGYIRMGEKVACAAVASMANVINVIKDKYGNREKIVRKIEKAFIGFEHFATSFIGDNYKLKNIDPMNYKKMPWYNPWETTISEIRNESFEELMELASKRYQNNLDALLEALQNNTKKRFKELVGNKSFLSGLELDS